MNKRKFQQILEHIAKANHTTPEDVRREMLLAMKVGQNSPDPAVRAKWNAIPRKGNKLTLEEFIAYAAREASLFLS